ncbi:MAG: hypothetical protein IIA81_06665 [Thaumarchaeota archaeon]|nr:hypothetical protein [Nitrososphaerota archaeon]
MRYQCASCDREGKTIEELSHCIELRHEIIDYPDENDIRDNNSKKQKNSKVKGFINDELYVESVIIDGEPKFLVKGLLSNTITIKERIETEDTTYRPLEKNECGYFPYNFTSDEIQELTKKPIGTEQILDEIKEQIDKYIVAREIDKHLILGNILLTYSQEWIHTIHFLFLVGETESGKSTVLHLGR